eukprot:gene10737-20045_t
MPKWHECDFTDAIALFRAAGGGSYARWRKVYTYAVDPKTGRKLEAVTPVVTDPSGVLLLMAEELAELQRVPVDGDAPVPDGGAFFLFFRFFIIVVIRIALCSRTRCTGRARDTTGRCTAPPPPTSGGERERSVLFTIKITGTPRNASHFGLRAKPSVDTPVPGVKVFQGKTYAVLDRQAGQLLLL